MRRYLPWQDGKPGTLSIKELNTEIGCFYVGQGKVGFDARFGDDDRYWTFEADLETIEDAIAVCEQEYIALCTEFLRLAGPGQVVVGVKLLRDAREMIRHSGCKCPVCEGVCTNLTAAIDAASKE